MAPKSGARGYESGNSSILLKDDGGQVVGGFRAECRPERRTRLSHDESLLHDFFSLLHEIEINVSLARNAVASITKFDRVNRVTN